MSTVEQAPKVFKTEAPAPNNTLILPDGQVPGNLDPQGYNFKILKLLTTDCITKIPFEDIQKLDPDFKGRNGRRERNLAHTRISACRLAVLKPLGWTIVVSRQSGENKMLHTFVSLAKEVKPMEQKGNVQGKDGDSAQKSKPRDPRFRFFDPEDAISFIMKLRREHSDLYEEGNGSVPTSSPERKSPKDEVRS